MALSMSLRGAKPYAPCAPNTRALSYSPPRTFTSRRPQRLISRNVQPVSMENATPLELPIMINTTPHARELRRYFYSFISNSINKATDAGVKSQKVRISASHLSISMIHLRSHRPTPSLPDLTSTSPTSAGSPDHPRNEPRDGRVPLRHAFGARA